MTESQFFTVMTVLTVASVVVLAIGVADSVATNAVLRANSERIHTEIVEMSLAQRLEG